MKRLGAVAIACMLAALAGCTEEPSQRDPAFCVFHFNQYDRILRTSQIETRSRVSGRRMMNADLQRQVSLLISGRCLTFTRDLDGLEALADTLEPRSMVDSGPAIAPVPMHAGVVTSIGDETRAVTFFRGLGYNTRTVGAQGLGRRVLVGPFRSEGALREALSIAEQAGFVAPYPAQFIRF